MNWEHFKAFVWLRWRLLVNQWQRGGRLNAILMTILAVGLLIMAIPSFVISFLVGLFVFPKLAPTDLLYVWDGMIIGFVFFWAIGILTELQRTEPLSLSKFMHLPVSVNGAFLINYLSSLMRLSLIVFMPVMFGCGLALIFAKGALLLCVLPLTVAFLLMVTAVTYQFQGWLASLMSNPRRRRTIVMVTTGVFVLILQLPSLLNAWRPRATPQRTDQSHQLVDELAALNRAFQSHEFDATEHMRRQRAIRQKHAQAAQQVNLEGGQRLERTAGLANLILPVGWLPLGVRSAAAGNLLPAILAFFGMTLIGSASLWRAYRTTIGLYQGQSTAGNRAGATAVAAPVVAAAGAAQGRQTAANLLETRIAGLSEPVSAVVLATMRSLMRSPESRMMLLASVVMDAFFGSMLLKSASGVSEPMRTLIAIGAIAVALLGVLQLLANQFGIDRDGFRVFVLCAASRRDILLGKNLAFAPLALAFAAILLTIVEVVCPLRWDHLLSMIPQAVSMFLLFCLLTNLLSIYAPMHIAAGSLKPSNAKLLPGLLQMLSMMCFLPLIQAPTLLPLGIESYLAWQGWISRAPVCLALSIVECAAIVVIYRIGLNWEGTLLRAGEQRILDTVTNRAP